MSAAVPRRISAVLAADITDAPVPRSGRASGVGDLILL